MKRILLSAAILIAGITTSFAQNSHAKVGAHIGLPITDFSNSHTFNLGVDFSYVWQVGDRLELGAKTGFSHFTGTEYNYGYIGYSYYVKYENVTILPIAATTKWNITRKLFTGTDLGYAFFLSGMENTGSFYFQPQIGIDLGKNEIYLGYKNLLKSGETLSTINLGYAYNF